MKKLILICMCLFVASCAEKRPPLAPTQIVNGRSIVMPPEFFVLPKPTTQAASYETNTVKE